MLWQHFIWISEMRELLLYIYLFKIVSLILCYNDNFLSGFLIRGIIIIIHLSTRNCILMLCYDKHFIWISELRYYFLFWEFFTLALADSFLLESEWQQVSSLQDSSQYSGQSQQCCNVDSLHSSSCFQVFHSQYQIFDDCTECTNYNCYHCHFHIP